jgi:uncharacterized protein YbaP (TraB family)
MSIAKVTPINGRQPGSLSPKILERIERARGLVFEAHSIAAVAAAAAVSEMPADEHCTETTLRLVATMLDKVAALIEPVDLAQTGIDPEVSDE